MKQLAIFASGSGSNAENLVRYFEEHKTIRISIVVSDRKQAFVFERMKNLGIPSYYMSRDDFDNGSVLKLLREKQIDFIVLAGFLKLVPLDIIHAYPQKIVNIHPALLPAFGGKGMYGINVHRAVVDNKEKETGITIHYVNENYDEGNIIFQKSVALTATDSPESVAQKIHELEQKYFPEVIEKLITTTT